MFDDKIILLVDDDENDVLLIQRAFQRAGLRANLKVVRTGQQAVDYLGGTGAHSNRAKDPLPFLVLLDLKMPGMDGFDVLEWTRRSPELKHLLVVVLTSSNVQSDVDHAYELGANSYLVKPVNFDEMVHLVQRFEAYWSEINRISATRNPTGTVQSQTLLR